MLMGKCEFGMDDYSLNIVNLPMEEEEITLEEETHVAHKNRTPGNVKTGKGKTDINQSTLF